MKSSLLLAVMMLFTIVVNAQCKSGDCKNGKGKYDFGWCVYEGDFKNEKPEGNGIMKYDDYTYEGSFKNGVEDGKGMITYKDGRKEEVMFSQGKKLDYKPVAVKEGAYKELEGHDPYCISGNCNTGYGRYVFTSGNRYEGNFKDRKREGQGTFYFASGNMFEGEWHNNQMSSGTYTYASGARYVGTYDNAGNELNGTVIAGNRRVQIANGKAIIIKEERYGYATAADIQAEAKRKELAAKAKTNYTQWGMPEKSAIERDRDAFDKMMHESDARDRAYNEKWGH